MIVNRTTCIAIAILFVMIAILAGASFNDELPALSKLAIGIEIGISAGVATILVIIALLWYPKPTPKVVEYWPNTIVPKTMEYVIESEASNALDSYIDDLRERIMDKAAESAISDGSRCVNEDNICEAIKQVKDANES
jgi:hypothetical protein